jgi:hypothetical protein
MLYIVISRFRRGFPRTRKSPAAPVSGEPTDAAAGLTFAGSWVETSLRRCFQLVECNEPAALQRWVARWRHCAEFEVVPVLPSADSVIALQPLLE